MIHVIVDCLFNCLYSKDNWSDNFLMLKSISNDTINRFMSDVRMFRTLYLNIMSVNMFRYKENGFLRKHQPLYVFIIFFSLVPNIDMGYLKSYINTLY